MNAQRRDAILLALKEKDVVSVQELVKNTGASESTIRRDLTDLEKESAVKRVHGGASLSKRKTDEATLVEKQSINQPEKKKIAAAAAALVKEKDCLFLDAGTTTLEVIPYLEHKDVVVVTNGIPHVQILLDAGIDTYVLGGKAKQGTAALVGDKAAAALREFRFDLCFLGINGIDKRFGYTTPDPDEALIKRTALSLSAKTYVLADQAKIGEVSFARVASLDEASIITSDKLATDQQQELQSETQIKVVTT
ncbi:DeoR/GlpR family DNA-binding transcription regulator [Alteribacillus sp. HJP-4]|uniref:DeoR/GlpR family DNA-binding transcription regulator n=1 Tax=Alteribacillus sp. HJP-4 TaxID=2775394 RepID=UPI0035CCE5B5